MVGTQKNKNGEKRERRQDRSYSEPEATGKTKELKSFLWGHTVLQYMAERL